ncbi:MAG: molecular chaperone TorD family protein [Nitrospiraceae bacterium]|nr:molecular chaperone TorD family protein [Nitrospiraceae bacterium]
MTVTGLICLYKILSLGFSYPEEKNWIIIERILSESQNLFDGEMLENVGAFKEYFAKSRQKIEDMESEYLSIFDVGGKISPYETEYLTEKISRKPFELSDIAGFYNAFGFVVNENISNKEAVDHISVELEFMAILALKEEYARVNKHEENLQITQDARMKFLREHLAKWGFSYCHKMNGLEGAEFYKSLGIIMEVVLQLECDRYGLDAALFRRDIERESYSGVRGEDLTCGQILQQ